MQISYDKVADALYLRFSQEEIKETEEFNDGIIIDYGENDDIIGIEILNFTERKVDLNKIIQLNIDEIIPVITQCE